ncbi:hypothetical protein Acr_28g0009450 [Actinidia rufa]|uniref:Uncharacterized protein n=1 Tax=Actinidia rufa TaxID=165716 RepID=A0A7J0HAV2_9ERIC|nr:hypothetical protein Acr_28g0009450 [Actinidia rufa]
MSASGAPNQQQSPLKRQLPFAATKPPFGGYHHFSASVVDHRQNQPEGIVVKSPTAQGGNIFCPRIVVKPIGVGMKRFGLGSRKRLISCSRTMITCDTNAVPT